MYETTDAQKLWESRGTEAWYLRTTPKHYQCHRCYVPVTRSERIAKTVEFFPHNCAAPQASARDNAVHAAQSLADALKGHQAHDPYDALGDLQLQAIQKLSDIFSELAQKKTKNAPPPEQTSAPPRVPQTPQLTRTNNKQHPPPNTVKPPRVPPIDGPHLIPLDNDDKTPRYNLRSRANSIHPTTKSPHNYMQTMSFCSTAIPKCTQKLQSHAIINKIMVMLNNTQHCHKGLKQTFGKKHTQTIWTGLPKERWDKWTPPTQSSSFHTTRSHPDGVSRTERRSVPSGPQRPKLIVSASQ